MNYEAYERTITYKEKERQEIAKQVEEYLAKGGTITKIERAKPPKTLKKRYSTTDKPKLSDREIDRRLRTFFKYGKVIV
jgi:hypothetical protein